MVVKEPVVNLLVETFFGHGKVRLEQLKDLFRLEGVKGTEYDANLHEFLEFLEGCGVVECDKRWWTFRILPAILSRDSQEISDNQGFLLNPSTPFSNRLRIKEILRRMSGQVYWLDKHFRKEAFDFLLDAIQESVSGVMIISGADNVTRSAQADYKAATKEMSYRGIRLEWMVIPKEQTHVIHDRWI